MRFSPEYKTLQEALHARGDYGTSGFKHADRIMDLSKQLKTRSILDYGCGQQTLQKGLPFPITNYDPFLKGLDAEPEAHDLVVCSDVLEHIEPECLENVLLHLQSKVVRMLWLDVACRPANSTNTSSRCIFRRTKADS